jgi:hypothetical protein
VHLPEATAISPYAPVQHAKQNHCWSFFVLPRPCTTSWARLVAIANLDPAGIHSASSTGGGDGQTLAGQRVDGANLDASRICSLSSTRVTGKRLLDDELAQQILMHPEFNLPLHLVAMDRHLLDDELAAHFMMLPMLDQGNSHSPTFTEAKRSGGFQLRAWTILLRWGAEPSTTSDLVAQLLSHSGRFDRCSSRSVFSLPFWELFDRIIRKVCLPSLRPPSTAPRNEVSGLESQLSARFQIGGVMDKEEAVRSGRSEVRT